MPVLDKAAMQDTFDGKAQEWVEYNASGSGKLRHAIISHNLKSHLRRASLKVLDAGGGTGEMARDLATAGHTVTLLDFSPSMVEQAGRRCAHLSVNLVCADVHQLAELFDAESFDLVLCHSLLEFLDQPRALVEELAGVTRAGGLLSIVVGNRCHLPLRAALVGRDFRQARLGLDHEIPALDLFGLPRRTFIPADVRAMIESCGMRQLGEFGVRIFADLLGEVAEATPDLLALELAASSRAPYRHLARYVQIIAKKE